MAVTYDKAVSDEAKENHLGLFTIQLTNANKIKGKLGSGFTVQGKCDKEDYALLDKHFAIIIRHFQEKGKRNGKKKQSRPAGRTEGSPG